MWCNPGFPATAPVIFIGVLRLKKRSPKIKHSEKDCEKATDSKVYACSDTDLAEVLFYYIMFCDKKWRSFEWDLSRFLWWNFLRFAGPLSLVFSRHSFCKKRSEMVETIVAMEWKTDEAWVESGRVGSGERRSLPNSTQASPFFRSAVTILLCTSFSKLNASKRLFYHSISCQ